MQESLQLDAMRSVTPMRAQPPADNAAHDEHEHERRAACGHGGGVRRDSDAAGRARRAPANDLNANDVPVIAVPEGLEPTPPQQPRDTRPVQVSTLTGPTIKSHPWEKMLAGRKPDISALARAVPEDFYFAEFRALTRLLDAFEAGDLWGSHLSNQAFRDTATLDVGERIKRQLAVETDPRTRPFYDLVVEEVAVAGSDPFVREGSDVTLLFRVKQPLLFRERMDGFIEEAAKATHRTRAARRASTSASSTYSFRRPSATSASSPHTPRRGCTSAATRSRPSAASSKRSRGRTHRVAPCAASATPRSSRTSGR